MSNWSRNSPLTLSSSVQTVAAVSANYPTPSQNAISEVIDCASHCSRLLTRCGIDCRLQNSRPGSLPWIHRRSSFREISVAFSTMFYCCIHSCIVCIFPFLSRYQSHHRQAYFVERGSRRVYEWHVQECLHRGWLVRSRMFHASGMCFSELQAYLVKSGENHDAIQENCGLSGEVHGGDNVKCVFLPPLVFWSLSSSYLDGDNRNHTAVDKLGDFQNCLICMTFRQRSKIRRLP
mmetsp:Transcript_3740/g.8309  ORF Transcript_3740/g.8309 Transcript_3740/m.8309 type:complete len:234 (-) Transcript_3740:385-1086(-)